MLKVVSGNEPLGNGDSALLKRAKIVSEQMRYFALAARKCSIDEIGQSAKRATFVPLSQDVKAREICFVWNHGDPDFVFSLSYKETEKVWIVAESQADIFGLTLITNSLSWGTSVETKPWLGVDELGPGALRFKELLLTLPGFVETPAWAMIDA
jgi:hypothetical protein